MSGRALAPGRRPSSPRGGSRARAREGFRRSAGAAREGSLACSVRTVKQSVAPRRQIAFTEKREDSGRREQGRARPHVGRGQPPPDDPASSGLLHGPADPGATRRLPHGGLLDAATYGGSLHSAADGGSLDGAAPHRLTDDGPANHSLPDAAARHGLPDDDPANPGAPPRAAARGPPDDPAKPPASQGLPKPASGHSPSRDAPGSAHPANGPAHPPLGNPSSHRHFSPPSNIT